MYSLYTIIYLLKERRKKLCRQARMDVCVARKFWSGGKPQRKRIFLILKSEYVTTRVKGDRKDGRRGLHVMMIVILIQLVRFIQLTISLLHTYFIVIFSLCSQKKKIDNFFLTNGGNFLNFFIPTSCNVSRLHEWWSNNDQRTILL